MTTLLPILTLLLGLGMGFGAAWWVFRSQQQHAATSTEALKQTFQALSGDVLAKVAESANQQLLTLAQEKLGQQNQLSGRDLDTKKQLIDQQLHLMQTELKKVNDLVTTLDKNRAASFSTLTDQLAKSHQQVEVLRQTTADLKSTLSNSRIRGQWGERMAEDVLRLAGFVEKTNYTKQARLEGAETAGKPRPDFTFLLPGNRVVHMDVKFPLDQYLAYVEATDDPTREAAKTAFLREARNRVKETAKRTYASFTEKDSETSLDYTLVFIPNEQVYSFLMEHDRDLLDTAMASKVILCSPTTLFAILSVIRQAMDNFQLQHTMGDAMKILSDFRKQWDLFTDDFTKLSQRFAAMAKDFTAIETTRYKGMERHLGRLENLKLPENTTSTAEVIELKRTGTES